LTGYISGGVHKIERDIQLFERGLEEVYPLFTPHMEGIKHDLLNWLKERGIIKEIGLDYAQGEVMSLLKRTFEPDAKRFVCVNGQWLPLLSASRKIASLLIKGIEVEAVFEGKEGIVQIKTQNLSEFCKYLRGNLRDRSI
jgi:hypothetical protein